VQAAQAANSALQKEIMLMQARLGQQDDLLQRSSLRQNMPAPKPAEWDQQNELLAQNNITGEPPSMHKEDS